MDIEAKYDPNIDIDDLIEEIHQHEIKKRAIDWRNLTPQNWATIASQCSKNYKNECQRLLEDSVNLRSHGGSALELTGADDLPPIWGVPGAEPIPNWGWDREELDQVLALEGDAIKHRIVWMTRKLQILEDSTSPVAIGAGLTSMGLLGIGVKAAKKAYSLYKAGDAFRATVAAGVKHAGVTWVSASITLILVVVLMTILYLMEKDAHAFILVANRSSHNLKIKESYRKHGKVIAVPSDREAPSQPWVAIQASDNELVHTGIFTPSKRDNALIGCEGALQIEQVPAFPRGVNIGYSIPLVMGGNTCGVALNHQGDAKNYFDKWHKRWQLERRSTRGGSTARVRMSNSGGGDIYMTVDLKAASWG